MIPCAVCAGSCTNDKWVSKLQFMLPHLEEEGPTVDPSLQNTTGSVNETQNRQCAWKRPRILAKTQWIHWIINELMAKESRLVADFSTTKRRQSFHVFLSLFVTLDHLNVQNGHKRDEYTHVHARAFREFELRVVQPARQNRPATGLASHCWDLTTFGATPIWETEKSDDLTDWFNDATTLQRCLKRCVHQVRAMCKS